MLDQASQQKRLATAIRLAGNRYDTAVNLKVESVLKNLYALNRESEHLTEMLKQVYKIKKENVWQRVIDENKPKSAELIRIRDGINSVVKRLTQIKEKPKNSRVRWRDITTKLDSLADECFNMYSYFEDLKSKNKQSSTAASDSGYSSSSFWKLHGDLRSLERLISTKRSDLFNRPYMLLRGEAGIGKTHLLCDYSKWRLTHERATFIFLGHELAGTADPIKAMAKNLGYTTAEAFLKGLTAFCDSQEERVCIIIDAINEGDQVKWSELSRLRKIKGLSLVISIRSGYDFLLKDTSKYIAIEHTGFAEMEWEAIPKFFKHYKLKLPEIPIIDPEFKNPLFLIIFCKAYSGSRKTPRGHGATHVFEKYIENQSGKILKELGLTVPTDYLWRYVIKAIGAWMGRNGKNRILRTKLVEIIKSDTVLAAHSTRLIQLMEHDGLLLKYPHYSRSSKRSGYRYMFTYHRFSDHLIIRSVLTENGIEGRGASTTAAAFLKNNGFLKQLIDNYDEGLIEALAIQIPERCNGNELGWLIPKRYRNHSIVKRAFIEGLKWRDVAATKSDGSLKFMDEPQVTRYLNTYFTSSNEDYYTVINCMLDVCAIPAHPFNANRLHKFMNKFTLPKRDAWWQEFLFNNTEAGNAIDRLHSWSLSTLPRLASAESNKLASVALVWTLAATNRTLRDTSTRSIVALLADYQEALYEVLATYFNDNNDPYITERLFAVVYGCVSLNPNDKKSFEQIVRYLYDHHFKNNNRIPNALQDDYAKGTIELYVATYGNDLSIKLSDIYPPYQYSFPKRIPSTETLKKKYKGDDRDHYSIWGSLMYGDAAIADFGNYTLGSRLRKFSNTPLDKVPPTTVRDKYDKFIGTLNQKQQKLLDAYNSLHRSRFSIARILDNLEDESSTSKLEVTLSDEDGSEEALLAFEQSLDPAARRQYEEFKKYITGDANFPSRSNSEFDLNIARRWMFTRVIQLGWNPDDHKEFDHARSSLDRSKSVKTERIGKKYQWIALFDFAARLGSHYYLLDDENWSNPQLVKYQGAYQINLRDFDPTIDPRWLANRQESDMELPGWWIPDYNAWEIENWKHSTSDIPKASTVIHSKRNGQTFLNLQGWVTWKGPNDPPEDTETYNYPELWMHINGYIIKKKDLKKVTKWCKKQEFWNHLLPEINQESNGVFLKEFGDSSAYREVFYPNYQRSEWLKKSKDRPFDILVPIEAYSTNSFDGDGSLVNQFDVYTPSYRLRHMLGLKPSDAIGQYESTSGRINVFDPSVEGAPGRETLLVNKDEFLQELNNQGLAIFWTILGEKMFMQSHDMEEYRGQRLEVHGYCYADDQGQIIENVRYKNEWKQQTRNKLKN